MTISTFLKQSLFAVGAICITFGGNSAAQALGITSSSDSALSGSSLIDFESAPTGAFTSLTLKGVTFSTPTGEVGFVNSDYAGQYNTQGQSLKNTYASNAFNSLRMDFAKTTNAFGFNWGASNVKWTLTAFDSANQVLDSILLPLTTGSNSGDFFGLSTGKSAISYATLISSSPGDYVLLDNFKYVSGTTQSIPTPALLPGLIGLGMGVLRKRKAGVTADTEA